MTYRNQIVELYSEDILGTFYTGVPYIPNLTDIITLPSGVRKRGNKRFEVVGVEHHVMSRLIIIQVELCTSVS